MKHGRTHANFKAMSFLLMFVLVKLKIMIRLSSQYEKLAS